MYNRQFVIFTNFNCSSYNIFSASRMVPTKYPHIFKITYNNILLNHLYKNDKTLWWKIIHENLFYI